MAEESRLKTVAGFCLGLIAIAATFILLAVLIRGMVWVSEKVLPWLTHLGTIAVIVCVVVLLPLCVFKAIRPWVGLAYYYTSYLFGIVLFAFSCVVVVQLWGYVGLIFGLLMGGVGVVPLAFFATLFHGEWPWFWNVVLGLIFTFGARSFGIYLSTPSRAVPQEIAV
jgi:hypothetical protein